MNYQKFKRNLCTACATASLFLIPAPQLWAGSSYAQSTRLSLELSNATISDVFASVEKNSEYRFFYSDAIRLELHRNVDVNINIPMQFVSNCIGMLMLTSNIEPSTRSCRKF